MSLESATFEERADLSASLLTFLGTVYVNVLGMELFEQMMSVVRPPDLMIYLRASVPHLVGNIQKRGRNYEQTIQLEYLENLNKRYDDFIFNRYKGRVMTVDKDSLDFLNNSKDLAQIIDRIDSTLFGLFPEITNNQKPLKTI